jgi:sentrin-specific protease 1
MHRLRVRTQRFPKISAINATLVVAETHIQSSERRNDGTSSVKRQRTKRQIPRAHRSRSTIDEYRKGGRGDIDMSRSVPGSDAHALVENFWKPPEFGLLKKLSIAQASRAPNLLSKEDEGLRGSLYRRHSDPSELTTTPERSSEFSVSFGPKPPVASSPRSLDSLPRGRKSLLGASVGKTLEDRLDGLLLGNEEGLIPSGYKKGIREGEEEIRRQKTIEGAILAAKQRRLNRRDPLRALVQPLNSRWEDAVNDAHYKSSHDRIITKSIGGTELRLKDFKTLLDRHAWLNDEIINSYIEWVVDAANKAADADSEALANLTIEVTGQAASKVPIQVASRVSIPKFIAHNSFFYENLIKKGPSSTQNLMRRKKAPGTALLEVDSVFVPICKGSHWTVGVVRPIAKTIEYFDSMGGSPRPFVNLMRNWLKFQLGEAYVEDEWKEPRTACARQNNGYDCGVFVCTNALCVGLGLHTSCYEEHDMTLQRRNIAAVLINRGFTEAFDWGKGGL